MGKVSLGTVVTAACSVWSIFDLAGKVFGAWIERKVVFFCREKGLGVSRGLRAKTGLGFEGPSIWEVSTELSMAESLKDEERDVFTHSKVHIYIKKKNITTLSYQRQSQCYMLLFFIYLPSQVAYKISLDQHLCVNSILMA